MTKSDLLVELYANLSTTGAVAFSSKSLVEKMLSYVDFSEAKLIVELGGGDGCITKGIVDKMSPDAHLLVFEINKSFCDSMERLFPQENVHIINDSAENLNHHLNGKAADYVVSSLPLNIFPMDLKNQILSQSKLALNGKGLYLQVSYSYFVKNHFRRHFDQVSTGFTIKNLPPAFVMVCR